MQYLTYKATLQQPPLLGVLGNCLTAKYKEAIYYFFTASWTTSPRFVQKGYTVCPPVQGLFEEYWSFLLMITLSQ